MKKFKTIMMAIVAAFTVAGMSNVGAAAQSVTPSSDQNLTITRTITNAKNNISNTFTYTITADSNNPENGVTGIPEHPTVVFNNVAPSGTPATATATGTISLSSATFTKNGDYKWTLTETATSDESGNYPVDSTNTYTIKASVRNATTSGRLSSDEGKQVVFFVYTGTTTQDNTTKLDFSKQDPDQILFTSATAYKHIEIKKEVTGNMADVDKDFTVSVTLGTTGQTFSVYGSNNNVTTISGGVATDLTLNHNDTIIIGAGADGESTNEIPVGMTYSYTEAAETNYTQVSGASVTDKAVSRTDATNVNNIVNNYETNTITGAFLKVLPYVVIVAIAVAGVVYLVIRNKKQKQIEE